MRIPLLRIAREQIVQVCWLYVGRSTRSRHCIDDTCRRTRWSWAKSSSYWFSLRRVQITAITDNPTAKPEADERTELIPSAPFSGPRRKSRLKETRKRDSQESYLFNVQRKSPAVGPHFVNKRHGKCDKMFGQIPALLPHDGVKTALAEMTIPFLVIHVLYKANRDRRRDPSLRRSRAKPLVGRPARR
jgi:hypothetical protein